MASFEELRRKVASIKQKDAGNRNYNNTYHEIDHGQTDIGSTVDHQWEPVYRSSSLGNGDVTMDTTRDVDNNRRTTRDRGYENNVIENGGLWMTGGATLQQQYGEHIYENGDLVENSVAGTHSGSNSGNTTLTLDQNSNDESNLDRTLTPTTVNNQHHAAARQQTTANLRNKSEITKSALKNVKRRRDSNLDIYTRIQDLDTERQCLIEEAQDEEQRRQWYHEQLHGINCQLEQLPFNTRTEATRKQLEYDAGHVQALMHENFGTPDQVQARHAARVYRLNMIEQEMIRIQQQQQQRHLDPQQQQRYNNDTPQQRHHEGRSLRSSEKRDSGTCDHNELEKDGTVFRDVATNTFTLDTKNGPEVEPQPNPRLIPAHHARGGANMGTQTTDTDAIYEEMRAPPPPIAGYPSVNNQNLSSLYHGAWPMEQGGVVDGNMGVGPNETSSMMSFHSSNVSTASRRTSNSATNHLGTNKQVEMVYSLLSMLGTHDKDDMSRTLLAMSSSQDSCIAMRQSGCLPLLIQLLHGSDKDSGLLGNTRGSKAARARAAAALHNIVHSHPDDKRGRREARVLRLLEQIRAHCDQLVDNNEEDDDAERQPNIGPRLGDIDHHPGPAIAALMKLSFDEEHRHAICTLGGLQAIAELLRVDHDVNGNTIEQYNITMRRYACMALTNLTFGDGTNKALLCSMKTSMSALVEQLHSSNEDLRQVAASVLRNLSWRADLASKKTLREVGAVMTLMNAALDVRKESTLKSILSALWNLSAHCSENKADICSVEGALAFLVSTLTYKSPSKTLAIIENGGGILRNISSHIAVQEDYRKVLRAHNCLQILLKHLRSPSLTIVSNACGTLWNLSARCPDDQQTLWEMGAVSMLRNLVHSKHKMISMGSAAALKNLLAARPHVSCLDTASRQKSDMPTLAVRKARALEAELDSENLTETCENVESPQPSPTEVHHQRGGNNSGKFFYSNETCGVYQVAENEHRRVLIPGHIYQNPPSRGSSPLMMDRGRSVSRSGSQDSLHSDLSHDRTSSRSKNHQFYQTTGTDRLPDRRFGGNTTYRSPDSTLDRQNLPNSRIVQAMHEVALHAGINNGEQSGSNHGNHNQTSSVTVTDNLTNLTHHMAELALDREDGPVNYSLNFQEKESDLEYHPLPSDKSDSATKYTETDLDNDQPTNYSIRYAEHTDENHFSDQPIDYSIRYQDTEHCYDDTNDCYGNDDQLKTFCTEGTPLNYLSTATSMNDLSTKIETIDEIDEDDDEVKNFAVAEPESNRHGEPDEKRDKPDVEKTKQFNVEGTPICFSRASSLSSLNMSDAQQQPSQREQQSGGTTPPASNPDTTKSSSIRQTGGAASTGGSVSTSKSVTFDDNNRIQETPMMFSRCTSLGSLDSFDTHSVHSSVISEYSRRASEVVSPSDLPDSPSQSMPPSPRRMKSPIPYDPDDNRETDRSTTTIETAFYIKKPASVAKQPDVATKIDDKPSDDGDVFKDAPISYAVEGTPYILSTHGSISELSFDADLEDEPEKSVTVVTKTTEDVHDSSISEVSEGEEDILAQCINSAMPVSSSLKKPKKQRVVPNQKLEPKKIVARSSGLLSPPRDGVGAAYDQGFYGTDSVQHYAVEGTPLNFSTPGSLSDISSLASEELSPRKRFSEKPRKLSTSPGAADDIKSDTSSINEENEELLSECIRSAMPKSKKRSERRTPDRSTNTANKSGTKIRPPVPIRTSSCSVGRSADGAMSRSADVLGDSIQSYATEGTPLQFSTATSLSDLSIISEAVTKGARNTRPDNRPVEGIDSPRTFGLVEGTPMVFSRNDSLSSLSCDEDVEISVATKAQLREKSSSRAVINSNNKQHGGLAAMKTRLQTPKRSANSSPGGAASDPTSVSMSSSRGAPSGRSGDSPDQLKSFAVEGTPYCFSRNSSLSSLHSNDDQGASSPRQLDNKRDSSLSCNSSLSSLSVDSNDGSMSERALLEECISSALPKKRSDQSVKSNRSRNQSVESDQSRNQSAEREFNLNHIKPAWVEGAAGNNGQIKSSSRRSSQSTIPSSQSDHQITSSSKNGMSSSAVSTATVLHAQQDISPMDNLTEVWRNRPHRSLDEIKLPSKSTEFASSSSSWRRCHSTENDFRKYRKQTANNGIMQKVCKDSSKEKWINLENMALTIVLKSESDSDDSDIENRSSVTRNHRKNLNAKNRSSYEIENCFIATTDNNMASVVQFPVDNKYLDSGEYLESAEEVVSEGNEKQDSTKSDSDAATKCQALDDDEEDDYALLSLSDSFKRDDQLLLDSNSLTLDATESLDYEGGGNNSESLEIDCADFVKGADDEQTELDVDDISQIEFDLDAESELDLTAETFPDDELLAAEDDLENALSVVGRYATSSEDERAPESEKIAGDLMAKEKIVSGDEMLESVYSREGSDLTMESSMYARSDASTSGPENDVTVIDTTIGNNRMQESLDDIKDAAAFEEEEDEEEEEEDTVATNDDSDEIITVDILSNRKIFGASPQREVSKKDFGSKSTIDLTRDEDEEVDEQTDEQTDHQVAAVVEEADETIDVCLNDESFPEEIIDDDDEDDQNEANRESADLEQALALNASLVVSELDALECSVSSLDDESLIENEQPISLVSNDYSESLIENEKQISLVSIDYTGSLIENELPPSLVSNDYRNFALDDSDTGSDVGSDCFLNETYDLDSEASTATLPSADSPPIEAPPTVEKKRARICRPGEGQVKEKEDDGPKAVRGGRKSLTGIYGNRSAAAIAAIKAVTQKPAAPIKLSKSAQQRLAMIKSKQAQEEAESKKDVRNAGKSVNNTPQKNVTPSSVKPPSIRGGVTRGNTKTPVKNQPAKTQPKTTPKANLRPVGGKSTPASRISPPKVTGVKNPAVKKLPVQTNKTKKVSEMKPTKNIDKKSDEETTEKPQLIKQGTFTKDSTTTSNAPVISPSTIDQNGNQTGTTTETKTSVNNTMTSTNKRNVTTATKIANNRNSRQTDVKTRTETKTATKSRLNQAGKNQQRVNSGTASTPGRDKSSGRQTPTKSRSTTPVRKSSLPGTPGLTKSAEGSRRSSFSSTPNSTPGKSDSSSNPGSATKKKTAGVVGKKQVSSRIATLWKKDESTGSSTDSLAESKTTPTTCSGNRTQQSKNGRRSVTPVRGQRGGQPNRKGSMTMPVMGTTVREGGSMITRSSTYDKIPSESDTDQSQGEPPSSQLNMSAEFNNSSNSSHQPKSTPTKIPSPSTGIPTKIGTPSASTKITATSSGLKPRSSKIAIVAAKSSGKTSPTQPTMAKIAPVIHSPKNEESESLMNRSFLVDRQSESESKRSESETKQSESESGIFRDQIDNSSAAVANAGDRSDDVFIVASAVATAAAVKLDKPIVEPTSPPPASPTTTQKEKSKTPFSKFSLWRKKDSMQKSATLPPGGSLPLESPKSPSKTPTKLNAPRFPSLDGVTNSVQMSQSTHDLCSPEKLCTQAGHINAVANNKYAAKDLTKSLTLPATLKSGSPATNAAIVQPFNYNPNQQKIVTSPTKPMTKTEMLMARRRQASLKQKDDPSAVDDQKRSGCMVTTV